MFTFDKSKKDKIAQAYKRLFATDDGQVVLEDMMRTFHVFNSTMQDSPTETAFNEGGRAVVLRIMNHINSDPKKLQEMLANGQS